MMKIMLGLSASLAVLYACSLGALYAYQRNLVFNPDPERVLPAQAGIAGVSEVTLVTPDARNLYCWYAPARSGSPVLLFAHGNGGSVSTRRTVYEQLQAAGYGVFMVGYPGYGGSEGEASEESFVEAAVLAYEHLEGQGFRSSDIVIYGQSLGAAVAVRLAVQKTARALILVAPVASARAVAAEQYPFVPIHWLLRDPFLAIDHIAGVSEPLLVIHGDRDEAIPIASGRALFDAAPGPKQFHTVPGGGHNDLYEHPIVPVLERFLKSV